MEELFHGVSEPELFKHLGLSAGDAESAQCLNRHAPRLADAARAEGGQLDVAPRHPWATSSTSA
ncbi:MAG TPA: hypothetical protein VGF12_05575 [Roseateles sp.]|uniref:hypothetical protein n=1 Tax=Roseateles sp. TaxID=1971397 RepID=UPI002EDA8480